MHATAVPRPPHGLARLLGWPRLRFTLSFSALLGSIIAATGWESSAPVMLVRTLLVGLTQMLVFGLFEQWPRRLPFGLPRWALQVIAVGVTLPFTTAILFALTTETGAGAYYHDPEHLRGYYMITGLGIFLAPWTALAAVVRQKEALARDQAADFALERSELERRALDARLRLLQAQVAPHFLFNTLANVQALVDAGSPQAATVLRRLTAYLRAAVPRLDQPVTTLDDELQLVSAYLDLMHVRMPDRLEFAIHADPAARSLRCPPMTLLTLVENAVRHGIDPAEDGGRIDVHAERRGERGFVRVADTGAGLRASGHGLGTGLEALRERLAASFGPDVRLDVRAHAPTGVVAELEFPARDSAT